MNLFEDDLIREYQEWKTANPNSFNWGSYVNVKADLHTALTFAKFYSPELFEKEGCLILNDRYDEGLFNSWMEECQGNKTTIEKMMNLYELNDFFHIIRKEDEEDIQLRALGEVLKQFWSMTFKLNYPNRNILVA